MQLPKLTPLQSRLLASLVATCLLIVVWLSFQPHHFVYAVELPPAPEDLGHSQLGQSIPPDPQNGITLGLEEEGEGDSNYVGDFAYFDRSLIGRAQEGVETLENNKQQQMDMNPGSTKNFVFEKSQLRAKRRDTDAGLASPLDARGAGNASRRGAQGDLENLEDKEEGEGSDLERRQDGNQVYISVNTCRQPSPEAIATEDPLQLTLFVSTSTKNQKPGPDAKNNLATEPIQFQNGSATFSLQTGSDVFIGVSAPPLTKGWKGNFHFEVAASVDGYYHSYQEDDTFLYMVDTDSESALFITPNLTSHATDNATIDKWANLTDVPFTMYAFLKNSWGASGLERSYCGLQESFNATSNITVDASMTKRYGDGLPKGQFHVQGLERNSSYVGYMVMNGDVSMDGLDTSNFSVGPGGKVWRQFEWKTKADDSCQVIFGLDFCADIAYAVPSSTKFKTNTSGLAALYDDKAKDYYENFSKSLAQIACDTTGTAQYSLARTCTDCARDYKDWLCSVLMPRCEDFSAQGSWLHERNINAKLPNGTIPYAANMTKEFNETKRDRWAYSKSRNPMIDEIIQPGPYKEVLPCEDLCYDIVRSCPAQLGFSCPTGPAGLLNYGRKDPKNPGNLTCNFPGAVVDLNMYRGAGWGLEAFVGRTVLVAVVVGASLWI